MLQGQVREEMQGGLQLLGVPFDLLRNVALYQCHLDRLAVGEAPLESAQQTT